AAALSRRSERRRGLRLFASRGLRRDQLVGDVVLVDVADGGDRLAADPLRGDALDVAEPEVRVQPALLRLTPQLLDAPRAGVVRGKGEQPLVQVVHRLALEERVADEAHVLDPRVGVWRALRGLADLLLPPPLP